MKAILTVCLMGAILASSASFATIEKRNIPPIKCDNDTPHNCE